MEFGRPKIIEPSSWLWRSSFFKIRAYRDEPFEIFHEEPATISEDGEETPSRIKGDKQRIRVYWSERGWGMGKWDENYVAISELCEEFPDTLKGHILEALKEADAKVAKWKEAIQAIKCVA